MEITRLGAGDEDRYRELRLRALADAPQAFASTLEREQAFSRDVWTSRLTNDRSINLLAVEDGTPLGMTSALLEGPATAHVLGMWVAPEARGRGVAHRLIEAVATWGREHRAHHMVLWVTEINRSARALYEKSGFVPTGERQPLPSDESLMEMKLSRPIDGGSVPADRTPSPMTRP
jgi:GNAT superfamily N-acetyltransferase